MKADRYPFCRAVVEVYPDSPGCRPSMIAKFTDQHEAQAFQDLMQDKAGAARYEVRRLTKSRRNLKHQDIT